MDPIILDLKLSGNLPGEQLLIALIEVRKTVDPSLLKRLDAVLVQQVEDLQKVWRSLWIKAGVIAA